MFASSFWTTRRPTTPLKLEQRSREKTRGHPGAAPRQQRQIATYNEGIDWVSADYMLLLSADDYLLPGALDRAAAVLDAHLEVGFVFGRAVELDTEVKQNQL